MRHLSPFDQFISQADHALRTVLGRPKITERADPSAHIEEAELSDAERRKAAGLMRVNHSGEVSHAK